MGFRVTQPTRESIKGCNISVSIVGQSLYIHLFFSDKDHTKGDVQFKNHRDTFITEQDFSDIAAANMNTVRILVGYWITIFDNSGGGDHNGCCRMVGTTI
jgi:aryl-phospho-beta-D-glucosidase BglC (GH1 family)